MPLSARRPRRVYAVRQHGVTLAVYRATRESVRATWRRDRLDVRAMDEAASEALDALWRLVNRQWLVVNVASR